jgi:UPF0716 protein FxsA
MLVLLLLILWPIAELFVVIKVAEAIGVALTILLLFAGWPIGSWALRSQGRVAWRQLTDAVAAGRTPGREVVNGALVLVGGILLIIPGFITDVLGIALLLPPSRALLRGAMVRSIHNRFVTTAIKYTRRPSHYDVDSTARDLDQPELHS